VRFGLISVAVITAFAGVAPSEAAPPRPSWIESFESSPATYDVKFDLPKDIPARYAQAFQPVQLHGTLRYRMAVSAAGRELRIQISNELGTTPLKIGAASVGIASDNMTAVPGSLRRLTFGGKSEVVIPPGAPMLSDPVDLPVKAMTELLTSVFLSETIESSPLGGELVSQTDGNAVMDASLSNSHSYLSRSPVTAILTTNSARRVMVGFGDSITDAGRVTPARPHGWVYALARRLDAAHMKVTAVSAGIAGNRIIRDGWGPSALARADRDVFAVPGVTDVILLEGINDIGMSGRGLMGNEPELDLEGLLRGYSQIAERAHARGLKVYIGTLTPFRGAPYFSEEKERTRRTVNMWIRKNKIFDAVIDFDAALQDPSAPDRLDPKFDSGDHLHPSDAGYEKMSEIIPLSMLK
jgi:lysophospholipase L1-like esterase